MGVRSMVLGGFGGWLFFTLVMIGRILLLAAIVVVVVMIVRGLRRPASEASDAAPIGAVAGRPRSGYDL